MIKLLVEKILKEEKKCRKQRSEKIEKIEEQMKKLKQRLASEKAKIRNEERKDDTRRKILVGAYFMEKYQDNMDELTRMIDPFLTRENDRKLFGLESKHAGTENPGSNDQFN